VIPLVVIVGPTAVGKSRLALEIAARFHGEIVSADSRQVYRFMDIGTAKPSQEEQARVPHHLIDVVDPDEAFTVACYRDLATKAIADITSRGKLPLLVGGTGLYVRTMTEGLSIPAVAPDPDFRRIMEARAAEEGADVLHRELAAVDPPAAAKIDPRNVRRVIRALEVMHVVGKPISSFGREDASAYRMLFIGLTLERRALYQRIDQRVDRMMEMGFLEEVEGLAAQGYRWDMPSMSGLGYQQLGEHLRGETDLASAVQKSKYQTHRFARQQYTWFRLQDPRIVWRDAVEDLPRLLERVNRDVAAFLRN